MPSRAVQISRRAIAQETFRLRRAHPRVESTISEHPRTFGACALDPLCPRPQARPVVSWTGRALSDRSSFTRYYLNLPRVSGSLLPHRSIGLKNRISRKFGLVQRRYRLSEGHGFVSASAARAGLGDALVEGMAPRFTLLLSEGPAAEAQRAVRIDTIRLPEARSDRWYNVTVQADTRGICRFEVRPSKAGHLWLQQDTGFKIGQDHTELIFNIVERKLRYYHRAESAWDFSTSWQTLWDDIEKDGVLVLHSGDRSRNLALRGRRVARSNEGKWEDPGIALEGLRELLDIDLKLHAKLFWDMLEAADTVLNISKPLIEDLPFVSAAAPAVKCCQSLLQYVVSSKQAADQLQEVASATKVLLETITTVREQKLASQLKLLSTQLKSAFEIVEQSAKFMRDFASEGTIKRAREAARVREMAAKVRTADERLHGAIPVQQLSMQKKSDDTQVRRILKEVLRPVDADKPTKLRCCLEGTRGPVLQDLRDLADKALHADGERLVWLFGPVGAGKTSVMSTLADELRDKSKVDRICTFFCRRNTERADPHRIFPTLADQLASTNPSIQEAIKKALDDRSSKYATPREQLRTLLLDPIRALKGTTTAILIDGLDECTTDVLDEFGRRSGLKEVVDALVSDADYPSGVVFVVASRLEAFIPTTASRSPAVVDLGKEQYQDSVRRDVERALRDKLPPTVLEPLIGQSNIKLQYEDAMMRLTHSADGLFILASLTWTVLLESPAGKHQFLRDTLSETAFSSQAERLASQFSGALEAVFADPDWKLSNQVPVVQGVLAALCCTYEPLTCSSIAQLVGLGAAQVDEVLSALTPLLVVSSSPHGPRYTFFHTSVAEFLRSETSASTVSRYHVDGGRQHGRLFSACAATIHAQLDFNPFGIVSSSSDFGQIKIEGLPPALKYAVLFWTHHLAASSLRPEEIGADVRALLASKFVFWLEALSGLRGVYSDGIGGLNRVSAFLQTSAGTIVTECQRCLQQWGSDISSHPCRTYLTVLPWLPSIFRQQLCIDNVWILDASPRVLIGAPSRWRDELSIWALGSWANSVAWSPDGRLIAAGKEDGTVEIRKSRTGEQHGPVLRGHSNPVGSVAFSPDSSAIASGSDDGTICLWDTNSGAVRGGPLEGHTHNVNSVAFSHDGVKLASGSGDGTFRLWVVRTGSPIGEPLRGHSKGVNSVAFSPDGLTIVSGSDDHTIRLWDASSGVPYGQSLKGHTDSVGSVAFSADSSRVASGSNDRTIRLWDVHSRVPYGEPLQGHTRDVTSVAFSPVGSTIASSSDDGTIRLWDATSGAPHGEPLKGHTNRIRSIAFSPDSSRIVSGSWDETVRLWDVHSGAPGSEPLDGHTSLVSSIAISPDGSMIASGSFDTTIQLWDVNSEAPCRKVLEGHSGEGSSVAFSPDGSMLASGSYDGTVRLWDTTSGALCGEPLQGHTGRVLSVAFSPDGSKIASGSSDWTVRLWDAHSGAPCGAPLEGHTGGVWSVAFSPDGSMVASGSSDGTVRLWDATSGVPCGEPLEGHGWSVSSVAFSPDGSTLASGSSDRTVRLWYIDTGAPLCEPLEGHTDWVISVAFSEDGALLFSLSENNMLVWDLAGLAPRLHGAESSSMRSLACLTPKAALALLNGYEAMVFSPVSRMLAGRFGPGGTQVFALRLPSYDPWKTLCEAHARSRRAINIA